MCVYTHMSYSLSSFWCVCTHMYTYMEVRGQSSFLRVTPPFLFPCLFKTRYFTSFPNVSFKKKKDSRAGTQVLVAQHAQAPYLQRAISTAWKVLSICFWRTGKHWHASRYVTWLNMMKIPWKAWEMTKLLWRIRKTVINWDIFMGTTQKL